jgi:AcrR family transcriptional regulator
MEIVTVTPPTESKGRRLNRAEKREANRERILRAARKVFGARGFHGATIEQIADEAGLSNGAIYYNFESKGDLFLALLEERSEERVRHIRRTLTGGDGAAGGLREEARDATRSLKENREWRLLVLEFTAYAARTPAMRPRLRAHERRFKAALAKTLEEHLAGPDGGLPMPPEKLALTASGIANGLALEELADPGSVPDELLGELLAKVFGDRI